MIRVLRLMEYVYPDVESMEADMGCWAIPANGKRSLGICGKSISSAVLPLTVLDGLPEAPLPDESEDLT